jgi:predicted MPP superfamily phosphohydrolase
VRARRRWIGHTRAALWAVFLGVQVPGVAAVATLSGSWTLAIVLALGLSASYLPHLAQPWHPPPMSRWGRAAMLFFFSWWAGCLAGWLVGPLALLAGKLAGLSFFHRVLGASLLSLAAGVRALWPHPRVVRRTVHIPGLPAAFDKYRVVQLSDVHCGPWTPASRVSAWVRRINGLRPDLVAVTGDLITTGSQYVNSVAEALGGLRARDGVFACMGNHDYFTDGEAFARALDGAGLTVLRNRGLPVERDGSRIYVAGVDDTWTNRANVPAALGARPHDAATVLLAHDPLLFLEAASRGVELTLSGHTHGGQIAVPGLARRLNLARLLTPFTMGLYRSGRSTLYVNRGAGTTGPPIRLGAPSEIAVLTLRAAA